jgi:Fe-S cluster assembly iron-binding protein IscA
VLQVTESAVSVLREARTAQQVPESYGLRVFAQPDESGQPALALAFAEQPVEGDQVSEQAGTEVYVAPELAEPLADHLLDTEQTPEGVALTLVPPPS